MRHTFLYSVWSNMKQRCFNTNDARYSSYGGRGINVCAEWRVYKTFEKWAFANGYKIGLVLDRINNDGNYEPANCRWVNMATSNNNRSVTINITAFGETKTAKQWCEDSRCVISYPTLLRRTQVLGWDTETALTTPPNRKPVKALKES